MQSQPPDGVHFLFSPDQFFRKVTLTRVGILDIFCPCWNSIDVSYSGGGRQPNYPVRSSPLCVYTKTESVVFCARCRTARSVPAAHADYALAASAAALRGVRDLSNVRVLLAYRAPVTICLTDKQA
jgi:hypothetical protein